MWTLLLPAQPFTLSHLPFPESSLTRAPPLLTLYPLKTSRELQGPKVPFRSALFRTVLPDFPLKSALHCSHHRLFQQPLALMLLPTPFSCRHRPPPFSEDLASGLLSTPRPIFSR